MHSSGEIGRMYENNMLVIYNCISGEFSYPESLHLQFGANFDSRPLWQILEEDGVASPEIAECMQMRMEEACTSPEPWVCFAECRLKTADGTYRWFRMGMMCIEPGRSVGISITDLGKDSQALPSVSNICGSKLREQEITGGVQDALETGQFTVHYQPQYNHATGMLAGAEALVRWNHPEYGLVMPGMFIPVLESSGLITPLDYHVFEQVCICLRESMDAGLKPAPTSVNFSRRDIFQPDFVERLEQIRLRHNVPVKYLRLEITEGAIAGGKQANDVVERLHACGYRVEMDDFGSAYSSLNVLKDVNVDALKLDMLFLSEQTDNNRGGTILSSVVRMAKWLHLPVIAEGVETLAQADFLRSIGCEYVQGYLYSKPLEKTEYLDLLRRSNVGEIVSTAELIDTLDAANFWNPESQETLIFSNYVGGAAIFSYQNGNVEILRVNRKYLQEQGMNMSEKELLQSDPMAVFDETNRRIYEDMLDRAIRTGEEQECETWRTIFSSCCGEDQICLRSNVRMIGHSENNYLFYAMIRNITAEKRFHRNILDSERRFKVASEQVNIYYWEYTVATHEMRPCFRCMRDLGLPALLTNYPESAFEMGIFPPEVHDMYRDWHRQIAEGAKELEAVIPLTMNRVPFRVRYTTEFDENGKPVKAYGSAALVV